RNMEELCNCAPMHQIGTDQAVGGEGALDDLVGVVGEAQQHKGDHGDRNLNANGILGDSEEVADFQRLFDPSEEQFDRPSTLVEVGDLLRFGGQVIGKDAQYL